MLKAGRLSFSYIWNQAHGMKNNLELFSKSFHQVQKCPKSLFHCLGVQLCLLFFFNQLKGKRCLKNIFLILLLSTGLQTISANEIQNIKPSELDLILLEKGILDKNYKFLDTPEYEKLKLKETKKEINVDPDNFKIIRTIRGPMQEFTFDITLLKAASNKHIEKPSSKYVDLTFSKIFPIYCQILSENIFTRVNPSTMKVNLKANDGSFIGEKEIKNTECDFEEFNYVDLTTQNNNFKTFPDPILRISPQIPTLGSNELNGKNRYLTIEILVNKNGDVEKVGYPSIHFSFESDKVFQKIKPALLNMKFYPYIIDGEKKPFLITQPIKLLVK
ncbi:hypothetical protein [Acinetobacter rudis]|nr:hypothetical protein [Acinetobacter rudis]